LSVVAQLDLGLRGELPRLAYKAAWVFDE